MNDRLMSSSLREEIRAALWRFEALTGQRVSAIRFERYRDGHKPYAGEVKEVTIDYRDRSGQPKTNP